MLPKEQFSIAQDTTSRQTRHGIPRMPAQPDVATADTLVNSFNVRISVRDPWARSLLADIVECLDCVESAITGGIRPEIARRDALEMMAATLIRAAAAAAAETSGESDDSPGTQAALTVRQSQILSALREGRQPAEIARELDLSVQTVRTHIRDACSRLDASGAMAAVRIARAQHLIS